MYLQPWQIFAGGCVCGVFISVLILLIVVIRFALRAGVRIEAEDCEEKDKGDTENG
jgi:hypothetical protein